MPHPPFDQRARLADLCPAPHLRTPVSIIELRSRENISSLCMENFDGDCNGLPNTTRRPVSQYIHVGEPALSRLSNALRNDGDFFTSIRSSHRAYISRTSIARSEPAFHMAKNRGMKQIPATCTTIWTSISATACVQTLRSCPEPQASVSLLSPPFPAEPALRHCHAKQEWRF